MQQSPVSFDLCLRKTRSEKSRGYRDVIVFEEKLRFQNVFRLRKTSVSEFLWFDHEQHLRKLRFPETSVWTEGLTVEIKLRFQISLA